MTYLTILNKTFTLVIVILFFTIIISCNSGAVQEILDKSLGTYYLDLSKSRINLIAKDSTYFKNLTFVLTKDSFKFSRKIPYQYDSIGTWETESIDVNIVYIRLKFRTRGEWQIGPGPNYIEMPYHYTIEKYPRHNGMLHFVKKD
jgi:hypothetical protein